MNTTGPDVCELAVTMRINLPFKSRAVSESIGTLPFADSVYGKSDPEPGARIGVHTSEPERFTFFSILNNVPENAAGQTIDVIITPPSPFTCTLFDVVDSSGMVRISSVKAMILR